MTSLEQAARQALDALIWTTGSTDFGKFGRAHQGALKLLYPAIEALRQALEQPESKKGCAECGKLPSDGWALYCVKCSEPMREWVGLTDEEVIAAYCTISDKEWAIGGMSDAEPFARAIESKLKEKNA